MPSASGLYYFAHEQENSTRPPVILIHGAGGTHLSWPSQVRRLDGQPMLAVDLPGHGKSGGVGRQSIPDYAADLLGFMDSLRMPKAVLAGHSLGSAIALNLALEHPGRLLGLVLMGAAPQMRVAPSLLEAASDASTFSKAVHWVTEMGYSRFAPARLKELAGQRLAETRPEVFHGDFLACDAFKVEAGRLAEIKAPTLVLGAEEDSLTPLWGASLLARSIPGARLEVIRSAGHMFVLEKPEAVASSLGAFLASLSDRPGGDSRGNS